MSRHRKQIRGDNRLSNTLNKPIGGQLGKKRSRVFVVTFGIVALLAFWWLFTSQLGIKAGSGATVFLVVALLAVTCSIKFCTLENVSGRLSTERSEPTLL